MAGLPGKAPPLMAGVMAGLSLTRTYRTCWPGWSPTGSQALQPADLGPLVAWSSTVPIETRWGLGRPIGPAGPSASGTSWPLPLQKLCGPFCWSGDGQAHR